MYQHVSREETGCSNVILDKWGPYRGKYPDPTLHEFNLIKPYLTKFACEDDSFDESKESWVSLKNRLGSPHLRRLLLKYIHQVRGSKGYDVDLHFDFIRNPSKFTVFVPRSLEDGKFSAKAKAAADFAIGEINMQMGVVGKSYEVVSVEKYVLAIPSTSHLNYGDWGNINVNQTALHIMLLTINANENKNEEAAVTFQAMVRVCDDQIPSTLQLREWKFKPIPVK